MEAMNTPQQAFLSEDFAAGAWIEPPALSDIRATKKWEQIDVANSMRLSVAQIAAMETRNWSVLPGASYIKGFLRNYCKLLGVEATPYLDQFARDVPSTQTPIAVKQLEPDLGSFKPAKSMTLSTSMGKTLGQFSQNTAHHAASLPWLRLCFVALACTFAFLLYWERAVWFTPAYDWAQAQFASVSIPSSSTSATPTTSATPVSSPAPVVANALAVEAPTVVVPQSVTPVPDVATGAGLRRVDLVYSGNAWVDIKDAGGELVYSKLGKNGEADTLALKPPLTLVTGAAHNTVLKIDGKAIDLEGIAANSVAKFKIQ